jgi:acyl carrier protein
VLQLAPVAFDASTLEIWGALLTGATLVVAPPGRLGLAEVAGLLRDGGVTVAWLTAGLFHQLAEADLGAVAGVPVVLAGGDALNPDVVRVVLAARGGRPLVNGYGPTENTTFTTCCVLTAPGQVGSSVPIGRPIQQTSVYVLDELGSPVPVGVVGELFAGGDGLARGYVGNAGGTARVFVPDPFGSGGRLYRTGDLARWRGDGVLEFVGRVDDQVKIRGYRVEPGEVAAVLRSFPGVADSVVVAAGAGAHKHLNGYVIPAADTDPQALSAGRLREFLSTRLPDYMIPTGLTTLPRFPLNPNGKIDRTALPPPDRETREATTPPRGETEIRLAEAWARLLPPDGPRVGEIGREDSFFALGGNSLSAARLMFRIRELFDVDLRMAAFYEAPTLAASAASIESARSAGQSGPPAAPSTIGRRDRTAYRVPAQRSAPDALASHLTRLTDEWSLWRTFCLRGAGFPVRLLEVLGDTALAEAADAANADTANADKANTDAANADAVNADKANTAYAAEFQAAVDRMSKALYDAASLPALREAVAWQNRHALTTGIDALLRRGPRPSTRNTQTRQHESLVTSYLQRYCAKNDTIGFFGPVGWSAIDDELGIRITHAQQRLAARVTYLEGWAVQAVVGRHAAALRPWLVPRPMPFVGLDGGRLLLPLAPPVALTATELAVIRACDGIRDARTVAAHIAADNPDIAEADVFAVLTRLADSHRLSWQVDVAPQDIWPERTMRAVLARVSDESVRAPAEQALEQLTAARDELSAAAGDAQQVASSMAGLEQTFTGLTGSAPTRRAGELFAGRTLAYEECLSGDSVKLGADSLDGLRDALALVLDVARWFAATCGMTYTSHFDEAYRERAAALGTDVVPFTDFWLVVNEALFDAKKLIDPVVGELRRRWSAVLSLPAGDQTNGDLSAGDRPAGDRPASDRPAGDVPAGNRPTGDLPIGDLTARAHHVRLRAAQLRERVGTLFPALPSPWPMAVHHSPDLMLAKTGDRLTWVLGEVHPSMVTTRYATWLQFHDDPQVLRAALRHDLRGPSVWTAETGEQGGPRSRLSNALAAPGDTRLVYAHDSCGYDPATTLMVGECEVIASPSGLRVRRRGGAFERGLLEVVGDLVSGTVSNSFDVMLPAVHTPRVSIDDLVISRERWTMPAADAAFADTPDEAKRYRQARAWAARHGFPRHVFLRLSGERKPIYVDLTSLASIDLAARSLRRSRRVAGADTTVTVVEMLPTPDQAWLTDAQGERYTAELRMVAVDRKKG